MLRETTIALLVAAGFALVGTAVGVVPGDDAAIGPEQAAERGTQSTEISFTRQPSDGATVVVDRVRLSRGGFVAIHDTTLEPPNPDPVGSVIGVSRYLEAGVHTNVTITLSDPVDPPDDGSVRVIAMPHRDTNGNRVYDFVISNGSVDGPYTSDGSPITDPATLDLTDQPLPPEASMIFDNQSLQRTVTVESVTLSDGGFVAILDEDGDVIGVSQYLESETQENVRIRLAERPDEPANLTARAHLDTNDDRVFGFDISDGDVDRPYPGNVTDTARVTPRIGTGTPTATVTFTPTASAEVNASANGDTVG